MSGLHSGALENAGSQGLFPGRQPLCAIQHWNRVVFLWQWESGFVYLAQLQTLRS
jgi:hypothetical protein